LQKICMRKKGEGPASDKRSGGGQPRTDLRKEHVEIATEKSKNTRSTVLV